MGYCVSRNITRWILAQRTRFQQSCIASTSNRILAVLHYFFDLCFTADTASKINFQTTPRRCNRMGNLIRYPVMKTVKDAAAIYGLPPTYIRTLCRTGKIRYVVAGHRWLVNMNSLAQYFERGDPIPAEQGEAVGGIRRVAR